MLHYRRFPTRRDTALRGQRGQRPFVNVTAAVPRETDHEAPKRAPQKQTGRRDTRQLRVTGGEVGDDENGNEASEGWCVSGRQSRGGQVRWEHGQHRFRRRVRYAIAVLREA